MECVDKISDEYREYWEETANNVFNQVMGTLGQNYLGKMFSLNMDSGTEVTLELQSEAEQYGLSHNRVLDMARTALVAAISSTTASRGFTSGFSIDDQGSFYPPKEKAMDICRGLRKDIQSELKFYWLDIDDLSELCGMTYEKEDTNANLAFFPSAGIPANVEMLITLDDSTDDSPSGQKFFFDQAHLREVRKFLAGVPSEACLLFTGRDDREENIYVCRGSALVKNAVPPIRIELQGRKGITFYAGGMPWFRMHGAQILAPIEPYRIAQVEICKELNLQPDRYKGLFEALSRQSKGASVVFVDFSCDIVDKWYRALATYGRAWKLQGYPAVNLTEEQQERICSLSRIDGALIVDIHSESLVYAGAVLDALGITEGLRDRGARGNSVLAHVANLALLGGVEQSIAAAVYSEDGMVTSVLGSNYYGDRKDRLAKCMHPLIEGFGKN